jgi:kynurenine 3-monooxygenase
LNKSLLDELEKLPNVTFFFHHKLVGADFRRNLAWFEQRKTSTSTSENTKPNVTEVERPFDFMIGADGAHSAVRYHLMKFARMSYQQEYIETLWCEFHISAKVSKAFTEFHLPPNYLHIWPAGTFMFIAIPSLDKSFTATLFLSAAKFQELDKNPELVVDFFKQNFPGVVPDLLTEQEVITQYKSNPHLPLISIRCNPYHFASSVVILGDAAHAMVPFYGQGMNAGLEDVRVLYDHLDAHPGNREAGLAAYTVHRHPDAMAINDLALANSAEMSSHVKSPLYLMRKWVEEQLNVYVPVLGWATQYSRVSFGNERYSAVKAEGIRQQRILRGVATALATGLVGGFALLAWRLKNRR